MAKKPRSEVAEEPDDDVPEDDVEMGFFEHLAELRTRLVRAVIGCLPGMAVGWFFKEDLLEFLVAPMVTAWHQLDLGQPELHFASPIDPFVAYLKIAVVVGLLIGSPFVFWQLWAFVSPGLYRREKRLAIPFVVSASVFFVGGAYFGYAIVFPLGFETFLGFAGMLPDETINFRPTIMINDYLTFATRMLLAFGITFLVPVIVTFLSAAGIVNWKQLLKFSRWWILISTLLAAFLTPPDVGSQLLMLIPLVVLYFLSIGLAAIFGYRRSKQEKEAADQAADEGYER